MASFVPLIDFDDLPPGSIRRVEIGRKAFAVIRLADEIYAMEDRCSHEEVPLSEGYLDDGILTCSMHGAQFDPKTGEALSLPAYEAVRTFTARVNNGKVEIEID
jgi:3-phenylpropionate/trans-cinnamate dioxygenase ferredoxin subunit